MPDAPELNLDSILSKEKLDKLSQLDSDFYEKAAKLLKELEAEKSRAEPGSFKDNCITDQLEVAKGQVREIIQERMHNIIRIALSQSVKEDKGDAPALTHEETELYNALCDLLSVWRGKRLDQVFGKRSDKKEISQKQEKTKNFKDYTMVRLLTDVPTFVGLDNCNYTLAKEDVAMVPGVNAKALIARKTAVQIAVK
jgi:DNA replication initiation complex subunit (GINS family)